MQDLGGSPNLKPHREKVDIMLKTFVAAACAALVVRFFHGGFDTCSGRMASGVPFTVASGV